MISTITLDTYKQQIGSGDAFNLSDSFNGRVGDEQVPLVVQFKERGLAHQFEDGLVPFLSGFVGSLDENSQVTAETGEAVSYVGTSDDIVGLGRVKMNLPGTMFPQEGYFYGFLGLQNADGKRVTTFNVWFHVYNGNPDMFVNKAPFRTELQKLLDAVQSLINDADGDLNTWKQKLTDLFTTLSAQGANTETLLTTLQAQIKQSNLFTKGQMDELMGSLADFKPTGSNLIDKLNNEFSDRGINVKWFGVVGDGKTDDTIAIRSALDAFKNSDSKTIVFDGTFLLSKSGIDSDSREYALKLDGFQNKNFDFSQAKFLTGAVDDMPNLFAFYNCKNINVKGGVAEADTSALKTKLQSYQGAFVYANECTQFNIEEVCTKNMAYLACMFNSNIGTIEKNYFTHTQQSVARELRPLSAILLYGSSDFKVLSNYINGGLQDGDLSVFGSGSISNLVKGNCLVSNGNNWEEGITVDGGAIKTIVLANFIEGGYNYGIDVKFNSQATIVSNNQVEKCVVAISVRGGEIGSSGPFETMVDGNSIIFGDTQASYVPSGFYQIGIFCVNIFSTNVKNNNLSMGTGNVDYPIEGVYIEPATGNTANDYFGVFDVSDNHFGFSTGSRLAFKAAGKGSVCLTLNSIPTRSKISNNVFKGWGGQSLLVKILGSNEEIMFNGNDFGVEYIPPIQYYGSAGCKNLIITENNVSYITNISNAYMWTTNVGQDRRSFYINNKQLELNQNIPFLELSTSITTSLIIRVKMVYDAGGTFLVDSTYKANLTSSGLTLTPLSETNSDIKINSMGLSSGTFALAANATRSPGAGDVGSDVHYHIDVYSPTLEHVTFA